MRSHLNKRNRAVTFSLVIAALILLAIWLLIIKNYDQSRIWRALLINYLFFNSVSTGLVVWPAIVVISEGEWMGPLEKFCRAGLAFSLPSIIVLAALWAGSPSWAPWIALSSQGFWMNNNFLFLRNILLLILFWITAFNFTYNPSAKKRSSSAIVLILLFVITLSLNGFDFIMSLNPKWHSMMIGGYVFLAGLYSGLLAWALLAVIAGKPDRNSLTDIGKLIVAFCLMTTYTMFSQLLPIWYENLPEESTFLVPLLNLAWKKVSWIVVVVVYLSPIILLMTKWSKRSYLFMGVVSLILLAGLWVEKWWLVTSVFDRNTVVIGWPEIIPAGVCVAIVISLFPVLVNYDIKERITA
jgi:hypothetical protein